MLVVSIQIYESKDFNILCYWTLVYQKPDPQPTLHLIRLGEKANEVAKKKLSILLRDVKTINCVPLTNDKRQQVPLGIDLTTADREQSFLVKTLEEKKEFITNLRKVCNQSKK